MQLRMICQLGQTSIGIESGATASQSARPQLVSFRDDVPTDGTLRDPNFCEADYDDR